MGPTPPLKWQLEEVERSGGKFPRRLASPEAGSGRVTVGLLCWLAGVRLLLCCVMPGEMTKMPGLMTNRHQRRALGGERRTVAVRELRPGATPARYPVEPVVGVDACKEATWF